MTILVAGGSGYIGSHFVLQMRALGQAVVVFDNLSTGYRKLLDESVPFVLGDIRDENLLLQTMQEHKVSAVVHFAASCYVGESVVDPSSYYHNNVYGSLVLLQTMLRAGVSKIVFSSSCATYGVGGGNQITEDTLQSPINPYGASKLMVERMLADFAVAYGLKYTALRYFNAAGADLQQRAGELHEPETHLIPLALRAAAGISKDVGIFGTDYPTADGTCVRDYVHVNDIAEAHRLALLHLDDGLAQGCFNLGSETGFSVRQILDACRRVTGRPVLARELERRAGDPPYLVASASKIRQALGWEPMYSGLDQIIDSAWQWMQKQ